jgi:hypothetical protein
LTRASLTQHGNILFVIFFYISDLSSSGPLNWVTETLLPNQPQLGSMQFETQYRSCKKSRISEENSMSTQQSKYLTNLNRIVILVMTLIGMLMDGYQGADLPIILSLVFWLWLPVCTQLEEHVFNYVDAKRHPTDECI